MYWPVIRKIRTSSCFSRYRLLELRKLSAVRPAGASLPTVFSILSAKDVTHCLENLWITRTLTIRN